MKSEVLGTSGEQILRDEIDLDYCIRNISVQTGEEFSLQFLQNLTQRRKNQGGGSRSSQEYQQDHVTSGRTIQNATKDCSQGLHATFSKTPTGNVTEQKRVGVGIQLNQNEQIVYEYHIDSRVSKKDPVNGTQWSDFWGGKGLQMEAEQIAYKDYTIKGYNQQTQQSSTYTNETCIHKTKCQPYNHVSGVPDGSYSEKMKFLCSFGGKILTRPSDGKLRYVGGDTRIISVKKNLNYQELMKKTYTICNQRHTIKYQLPGEDLEALISVCSDEDFYHMIDEYHELDKGSQRLRIFLESLNERESPCYSEARSVQQTDNAYKYVVAVNGITDSISPKNMTRTSSSFSKKLPNAARLLQSPSFQYRDQIEQPAYENPFIDDNLTLGAYDHQSTVDFKKHMINESAILIEKIVPSHKQYKPQKYKCEWDQDTIKWMDKNSLNLGFDLEIEEYHHNLSPATPLERQLSMATTVSTSDTVSNISSGLQHTENPQSDHILALDFIENDHLVVPNSTIFAPITSDRSMSQTSEDISDSLPDDLLLSTTELLYIQETHTENQSVSQSNSKDVEDDKRMRHGPISDATMAEIQAGIHGLQTIKNADLEELRELGCGTFGTVYHGKWRGTDVAIKRIKESCFSGKPSEQDRLTKDFWREAQILSQLHHPNVVALYGVVRDGPGGTLSTVTEYMANGSLRHVLSKRNKVLDKRKRLIIAQDAAIGMEYLHMKNIVHFDLKCDNLLVNMGDPDRPVCKVGDFGLSRIKGNSLVSGGARGTLPWIAPELLDGSSSRVSEKVDVFSFGITMWEILTGEEPYADMHCGAIIGGIVTNTLRPPIPKSCDHDWKALMEECWSNDPEDRPSFTQITNKLQAMSLAFQTKRQKCPRKQ